MQAGRELDAKVAEALTGDNVHLISGKLLWLTYPGGQMKEVPAFSTTWEGMGVLVEEARKQGIYLEYEHYQNKRYLGRSWEHLPAEQDWLVMPKDTAFNPPEGETAPHAVCLAFLKAKGIVI